MSGNDTISVGESISLESDNVTATSENLANTESSNQGLESSNTIPRKRNRRKKLGTESAQSGFGGNQGVFDDKPPKVESQESTPKTKKAWRAKYGEGSDDREVVCVTFASYLDRVCVGLANYIKDNGGTPLIDLSDERDEDGDRTGVPTENQKQWANLLILAMDDVLPENVRASPALITAAGGSALLVQGAIVAKRVKDSKKPQKPLRDLERTEEDRAKDAGPVIEPSQPPSTNSKSGRLDREGNRAL